MNEEIRLALLRNLLARMEYNEKQRTWSLKGSITTDEYESLGRAIEAYYQSAVKS